MSHTTSSDFIYTNTHPEQKTEDNYAATLVNAIAAAVKVPWTDVQETLFGIAANLGLLPFEKPCLTALLRSYGYVKQRKPKEIFSVEMLLKQMNLAPHPGESIIVRTGLSEMSRMAGALAYTEGGTKMKLLSIADTLMNNVREYWLRKPSVHPVPRLRTAHKPMEPSADQGRFHWFMVNPQRRCTGDCVVRALAATLNVSWKEALDLFLPLHVIGVNTFSVFSKVLSAQGFICQPKPIRNGRRVTAEDFCREMDGLLSGGERIFSLVTTSHATALAPADDGGGYRVWDSWDSSKRYMREYWIKPAPGASLPQGMLMVEGQPYTHRIYGTGTILQLCGYAETPEVIVRFPDGSERRLDYPSEPEKAAEEEEDEYFFTSSVLSSDRP